MQDVRIIFFILNPLAELTVWSQCNLSPLLHLLLGPIHPTRTSFTDAPRGDGKLGLPPTHSTPLPSSIIFAPERDCVTTTEGSDSSFCPDESDALLRANPDLVLFSEGSNLSSCRVLTQNQGNMWDTFTEG